MLTKVYRENKFVFYEGTWYNLKQTLRAMNNTIGSDVDSIYAKMDFPEAFYKHRKATHYENSILNRLLIKFDKNGNNLSLDDTNKSNLIASYVSDTVEDHHNSIEDKAMTWLYNDIKGAALGANYFTMMKYLGKKYDHGVSISLANSSLKLKPAFSVFSPTEDNSYIKFFEDGLQVLNVLDTLSSPKILEIGCGSGALSILLAKALLEKYEAKDINITATDILSEAIHMTKLNAGAILSSNASVLNLEQSNVFPSQPEKYSLIVSYPPFIPVNTIIEEYEYGFCDKKDKVLHRILRHAKDYLQTNGKIILMIPNFAELVNLRKENYIEELCREYGLRIDKYIEDTTSNISNSTFHLHYLKRFDNSIKMRLYQLSVA